MGLLCAEQDVGNLNKCPSRNSGTPVRRKKTSEISTNELLGIMGLLRAEQGVTKFKQCTFNISGTPVRSTKRRKSGQKYLQEFWDSCAQNKTSEISKNQLPEILGLLCAEQDVGNLKKCIFWNSGTPVRRTRRRKSQNMHFQKLCDSWAQNKTSEISKL